MAESPLNRIHFYLLCILMCFPVLHMKVANAIVFTFTLYSIVCGIIYFRKPTAASVKELFIYIFPFLLITASVVFYDKSAEAKFYLEKSLSLLVLPLAFFITPFTLRIRQYNVLLKIFISSTIVIVTWGLIQSIIRLNTDFIKSGVMHSYSELTSHPGFSHYLRTYFEQASSFHPTYASIFLGISFLVVFTQLVSTFSLISVSKKISYISLCFLLLMFQSILASRAPFAAVIVSAFIIFVLYQKKRSSVLWFSVITIGMATALFFLVPSFSARFKEVSSSNLELPNNDTQNSFNIRTGIYKCTFEIIEKNWLTGVGPGKVQANLNECFNSISTEVYGVHDYNTHNQYLDYWASVGVLGPIALIWLLIWVAMINIRKKYYLPLGICILFFIAFLTENILLRQYGVVIFALFTSLFGFVNKQKQNFS